MFKSIRPKNLRLIKIAVTLLLAALTVYSFSYMIVAKNTYVITDGDTTLVVESYAKDAEAVISEAGITLDRGDGYSTGGSENEILIARAKSVTLRRGGTYSITSTQCETVGEFLEDLGIVLSGGESVSPALGEPLYDGAVVTIASVEISYTAVTEEIPFDTVAIPNGDMALNTVKYIQQGAAGLRTTTYKTVVENGAETQTAVVESVEITLAPVDLIIEYGTKQPEPQVSAQSSDNSSGGSGASSGGSGDSPSGSGSSSGSGGDTSVGAGGTITTSSGEVLSYTKVISVKASAYTAEGRDDAVTAMGTTPRVGAVAVDPSVIPYGTKMYIVAEDGSWVYGYAVAEDCGVAGNKVDLYYDTYDECIQFGRRNAKVYILG